MAQTQYKTRYLLQSGLPFMTPVTAPAPVPTWEKNEATGKSAPTGPQAVDAQGTPLWVVTVSMNQERFGSPDPTLVEIVFPSKERPQGLPNLMGR